MKATIDHKALRDGLELVASALGQQRTLPVLGMIRVTANREQGGLQLHTTDLEQALVTTVPAVVERDGEYCVNGAKFVQVVKELPGPVVLSRETDKTSVTLRSGSVRCSIVGLGAEDFPALSKLEETTPIVVKAELLAQAIRNTQFAVSKDEARYALNGIRFLLSGKQAILAATDGHRLVDTALPLEKGWDGEKREIIVPKGALKSLLAIVKGHQDVELRLTGSYLDVVAEESRLSARLVEGQFPNIEAVKPKRSAERPEATLSSKALKTALRQASLMAEERNHPAKLTFETGKLTIASSSADAGDAEIVVPDIAWTGQAPVTIGVNATYLLDWLELAPGEIVVSVKDAMSPLLLNGVPTPEGHKTAPEYVVMPMRI